jgi:murein DD-endopeptidase MepM/ murein hydrolase activator NlpD
LELSKISKQARVICGSVLMVAAYGHVVIDMFLDSGNTLKTAKSVEIKDWIAGDTAVQQNILNLFDSDLQCGDGVIRNLIVNNRAHDIYCLTTSRKVSDVPSVTQNIVGNSINVVSGGEFSGAKVAKSKVWSNFYVDAHRIGVPLGVIDSVVSCLSPKIDFRRSLKRGDSFEVVYNQKNEVLYAKITTKRNCVAVYRFASGKDVAYYFENGTKVISSRKHAFGQPLGRGLQVASPFGYRHHPVGGKWARHTGVDLVASYGSPVLAVFDGIVTRASYYCGYGHCIDIKHRSGYASRYAHLSAYSVRKGTYVKRGQMIGRVGSSGTSTGSHLHLELARNNRLVNPLSVKMMPIESSIVSNMRKFSAHKKQIERIVSKY